MRITRPAITTVSLAIALLTPAFAQKASVEQMGSFGLKPEFGTIHLKTRLGSFRVVPKDPTGKAEGRFEMYMKGAVLISALEGDINVGPGIIKEFDELGRRVYHGEGKIVINGKWRALQWFGSDLDAVWYGAGTIRIIAEFDKDLKTGEYWYDDSESKGVWPTSTIELTLPERRTGVAQGVVPTRRGGGGN